MAAKLNISIMNSDTRKNRVEMNTRKITEANLKAWEEVAPRHAAHNLESLLTSFSDPNFSLLDDIELARLEAIGIENKDVAQVCCNNGRELICIERLGARRCVGFDGAQGFIDQGIRLAQAANADCEFVRTDIYDMPAQYNNCFDVVVNTVGVVGWMPDLQKFFNIITRLLRPGGALFIYETHPILETMLPGAEDDPVEWELPYFDAEPYVDTAGLDYYGGETYAARPVTSYLHTMSQIIMAGIHCGLGVEHFEELPGHITNTWWNVEKQGPRMPMSFTLVLRK